MTETPLITLPAGYATASAVGFSSAASTLTVVSQDQPLPVVFGAPTPTMLQGNTSASLVAGPFNSVAGRTVLVTLSGSWAGTVQLLRSSDDGVTKTPLRIGGMPWGIFTESGSEQVWHETEADVTFFLDIALQNGTLDYQVSQ